MLLFEEIYGSTLETLVKCVSPLRATEVLWRAGTACHRQSAFHKKRNDAANEIEMLEEGIRYTEKALNLNEDCWQAHKW